METLTDIQWCALDVLLRSKKKGVPIVSRHELLYASNIPDGLKVKLTWAMLTMPRELIIHHGSDFEISPRGERIFSAMFKKPTEIADTIIALPDRSGEALQ